MSTRRLKTGRAPKRVAFITPGLGLGGAERWVASCIRHFTAAVTVVGVFTPDTNGVMAAEISRFTRVYPLGDVQHVASDVVLAWGYPKVGELVPREKLIAVSHGAAELEWTRKCCEPMERDSARLAAVSGDAARVWHRGPVEIIQNGAELDRICPRRGREFSRRTLGIAPHERLALYLGRLSPEKRPEIMAQMAEFLPVGWKVIVAGPACGASIPAHPRVKVLPAVSHPGDLLAAADCFVLPSMTEGHPIALTEAWLASVPTVYADWPFAAEMRARHGAHPGTVVPINGTPEQWATAVVQSRHIDTDFARGLAWQHYTAPRMAQQWEDLILR